MANLLTRSPLPFDLAWPGHEPKLLHVAPCTSDEARTLSAVFAGMAPWSAYPIGANALQSYLANVEANAPRYAVSCGGEAAGVIGLRLDWLLGPYVQFLGVLPAFQSRGLGSLLLAALEDDAREAGQRNLWVAASSFNDRAQRFYARAGFVRAVVLDGLIMDGIDEILLRKRL